MAYVFAAVTVQFIWFLIGLRTKDPHVAEAAHYFNFTIMGVIVIGGVFNVLGNL